jgi:hypothetical protein
MLNIKDLSKPELPKQDNYEQALKLGMEAFFKKDPYRVAQKSGVEMDRRTLEISHLDRTIIFDLEKRFFYIGEVQNEAPIWLSILALHYLNNADGRQPTGRLKHFREFKDGHFYEPAFNRRTKNILVEVFGRDSRAMQRAGNILRGVEISTGDVGIQLSYFPYLPITCILWKGDDEFPPDANVLFDETADIFFSAEDMAVAGQMAVLEMLKASRA